MNETKKNKKKLGLFIALIGLIMIISASIYAVTSTDLFKDKEEKEEETEKDKKDDSKVGQYNGIYQNGDVTIKIYETKDVTPNSAYENASVLKYDINDSIEGYSQLVGNTITDSIFDINIYFEFEENMLNLRLEGENVEQYRIENGIYNKLKDYNSDDYFNDKIGDSAFFNSNYNGKYVLNGSVIYAYQSDYDEVKLNIVGSGSSSVIFYESTFKILEDGTLDEESMFEEEPKSTLIFEDDSLDFTSPKYEDLNGKYTRERKITIDEAISLN